MCACICFKFYIKCLTVCKQIYIGAAHCTPMSASASHIGSKRICSDAMLTPKAPSVCKRRRIATRLQFTKSPAVQVKCAWLYMYCVAV